MRLGVAVGVLGSFLATPAMASAPLARIGQHVTASGLKTVRYLGYKFRVPGDWPVIRTGRHVHGCVRFDQHALYLGAAGDNELCPSWLLGTTEAILVQPGRKLVSRTSVENTVARQITVHAPGIAVTATFDTNQKLVEKILASAALPAPRLETPDPEPMPEAAGRRLRPAAPAMHYPMATPPLPAAVTSYIGLGFDACSAPSGAYMRAWLHHSPYRAVGIYIGGSDRACAQPNLSRRWVIGQARQGWRFMPLYAGPQAAFGEIKHAERQGRAAARDAVAQARRLGFGRHTPLYYDMEAFRRKSQLPVLHFLSSWTRQLHRLGYASGVYSSSNSGIVDLAKHYAGRRYAMPNIIFDALWNGARSTKDHHLGPRQWTRHRRIHQFKGNVTQSYGGDRLNVDKDFLNVRVIARPATSQRSPAVAVPGGGVMVFYRGRKDELWFDRFSAKGGWVRPAPTGVTAFSTPSAVWTGTRVAVFYQGARGMLSIRTYRPDGRLAGRRRLPMMGVLGSAPRAVSLSDGVIDVFWRGSVDDHLWHGQFTPGSGWNGPQGLGGNLGSMPSPVTSAPGQTAVFWRGTDRRLWMMRRGLDGRWVSPRSLGMAPLGGAPQATAQPDGGVEVYWSGSGNPYLWEGFYSAGTGWRGPRNLGGQLGSVPWPATASDTVRVLWRGPGHKLDFTAHRQGRGWDALGWNGPAQSGLRQVGSAPFAAVGRAGAWLHAFWRGRGGSLWTATLAGRAWNRPVKLA